MISERFSKQRDLSIWLTIILPLYTVAYLMQVRAWLYICLHPLSSTPFSDHLAYFKVLPLKPLIIHNFCRPLFCAHPTCTPLYTPPHYLGSGTTTSTTCSSCRCTRFSPCSPRCALACLEASVPVDPGSPTPAPPPVLSNP